MAAVEEDCEVAMITRTRECGLVAEPGSAPDLAKQIMVFYRDRELAVRYGANARATGLAYDRKTQVARYMTVFTDVHHAMPARTQVAR